MHCSGSALFLLLGFCSPTLGVQLIVNGDFTTSLDGWTGTGDVTATSGFALLQESQPGGTTALFQSVGGNSDPFLLEFEINITGMSAIVPSGTLADTSFGTLYFGDTPFGTDATSGVFDEQRPLFDLDRMGLSPAPGVTVESILGRQGWVRLSTPFSTSRGFVTFVIEEIDLNLLPGDSVVALDNVSLTIIPEPSALLTLSFAIGLFLAKRIRPT